MKKLVWIFCALAAQLHGQLTVDKAPIGPIRPEALIVTDVAFTATDTLMNVTARGDEADSMKILREHVVEGVMVAGGSVYVKSTNPMLPPYGNGSLTWTGARFEGNVGGGTAWMGFGRDALAVGGLSVNMGAPTDAWLLVIKRPDIDSHDMYAGPGDDLPAPPYPSGNQFRRGWYWVSAPMYMWVPYGPGGTIVSVEQGAGGGFGGITTAPKIETTYEPVAARLDPVLVKDTKTNVVWRVYAENGRFFATIEEEKQ